MKINTVGAVKACRLALLLVVFVNGGCRTTIYKAAEKGDLKAVKRLLEKGTNIKAKDELGRTPLHWATDKNMVELLIANGADVNAKDNKGETPLFLLISIKSRTRLNF